MSKPDADELVEIMLQISELMRQMKVEVSADMPDAEVFISIRDRNEPERAHLMHTCCSGCMRNEIDQLYGYAVRQDVRDEIAADQMDDLMQMLRGDEPNDQATH